MKPGWQACLVRYERARRGAASAMAWAVALSACAGASQALALPEVNGGRALYLPLLVQEAVATGLPPELADAVAMVETGYQPDAVGSSGEVGLMQVLPATARQLGFAGSAAELAVPATNIRLGVAYLARAWAGAGGDICRAFTRYRAGLGQQATTPLSAQYCARAIAWLRDSSSRLDAGTLRLASLPASDRTVVIVAESMGGVRPMPVVNGRRPAPSGAAAATRARFLSHRRQYMAAVQTAILAAAKSED